MMVTSSNSKRLTLKTSCRFLVFFIFGVAFAQLNFFCEMKISSKTPPSRIIVSAFSSLITTTRTTTPLATQRQQQLIQQLRHQQQRSFITSTVTVNARRKSPISRTGIKLLNPFEFNNLLTQLHASSSSSNDNVKETTQMQLQEEIDPGIVEGTDLRIVKYPHPSLRATNVIITDDELANGSINKIVKEMFIVMYAAIGCGLAAPQVGINKRLMVYNPSGDKKRWLEEVVLINPIITERSQTTDIMEEGCLSFPGMNGNVERPKWIKVEALNLKGKKIKKKFVGLEARIFQHEYDHLDGIVYIDRLTDDSKPQVQERIQELINDYGDGGVL